VILGTMRVVDIHQNRQNVRRNSFLDNIGVRVEFLERNISLLQGVKNKFYREAPTEDPSDEAELLNDAEHSLHHPGKPMGLPSSMRSQFEELQPLLDDGSSTEEMIDAMSASTDTSTVTKKEEVVSVNPIVTLPLVEVLPVKVSASSATVFAGKNNILTQQVIGDRFASKAIAR
jgi:hypothetical protein